MICLRRLLYPIALYSIVLGMALATSAAVAQGARSTALANTPGNTIVERDLPPAMAQSHPARPDSAQPADPADATNDENQVDEKQGGETQADATPSTPQPGLQQRPQDGEPVLPTATVLRLKLLRPLSTATPIPAKNSLPPSAARSKSKDAP